MIAKSLIAVAALVATAGLTPAAAERFEFRYKSYELETQGGRTDLMARIENFVDRRCDANGVRGLAAQRSEAKCVKQLKAEIMDKIDNVQLAGLQR